jgi:hypothetical protein
MISAECVKISTAVSTAVENTPSPRAVGHADLPTAPRLQIRGISICQPSKGGVKRFDPTTRVKVTHRLDACNQKKSKKILREDHAETSYQRGFQGTPAF